MNNAIGMLYDEHEVITSALGITQSLRGLQDESPEEYEEAVGKLITFLREYADEYHHYKEEIILFPEMSKKNEMLEDGILKEMTENHEEFRGMIRMIESSLNNKEYEKTQKVLEKYVNMLLDHIAVENDEVFQVAESLFSEAELENIGFRFQDIDRDLGDEKKEALVEGISLMKEELE